MKPTEKKKLKLNIETLRQLQPHELDQAVGGLPPYTAVPCFPTDSEEAGGCTVSGGNSYVWIGCC